MTLALGDIVVIELERSIRTLTNQLQIIELSAAIDRIAMIHSSSLPLLLCLLLICSSCLITPTHSFITPSKSTHHKAAAFQRQTLNTKINLLPGISSSISSSTIISSETESWRQYVPLVVSVGVILDILLGSPLANLALGPMRRASEKGATGSDSQDGSDGENGGGGSLFSSLGGNMGGNVVDKSKERVDSEAIAQAAIDKARNTLELRQFLEENKTDEQRYEEVRKKIEKQMDELDNSM